MFTLRSLTLMALLAGVACTDERPLSDPVTPPIDIQGISAFITVDNLHARPGQTVRVSVEVRVAATNVKVGSYTGRLAFDPAALQFKGEVAINDGLRVANANGAGTGLIRFAGANATGFSTLTLYSAEFVVRSADYAGKLTLQMEELSAALSLANLSSQLRVAPQVYLAPPRVEPR